MKILDFEFRISDVAARRAGLAVAMTLALATPFYPSRAAEVEGLPKAGEPRRAQIAKAQEKTLANGLRVIVVERPGLPMLCAELLIKSGAESDPPKFAGLAHFTAGVGAARRGGRGGAGRAAR